MVSKLIQSDDQCLLASGGFFVIGFLLTKSLFQGFKALLVGDWSLIFVCHGELNVCAKVSREKIICGVMKRVMNSVTVCVC